MTSGPLPEAESGAILFGWEAIDLPLLIALPLLLLGSAFFSGSETALFGLTVQERMMMRRSGSLASRATDAIMIDQRMLLITILLGNMTINVLYFVMTSVLLMRSKLGAVGTTALALGFLLSIVLGGEVLPKVIGAARRTVVAALVSPILLALHRAIGPLRLIIDRFIVAPLSRLTAPRHLPPNLDAAELKELMEISSHHGIIDVTEQQILGDLFDLCQLKVRDVMTPRVRITAVPVTGGREHVMRATREARLTRLPVYRHSLDDIVGILDVRSYLLEGRPQMAAHMTAPSFVPEMARLDSLLDYFRAQRTKSAIVVDEYGGTEGIVSLEDVIERIVGDISHHDEPPPRPPELVGPNRWRIGGDLSVHDWAEAFGHDLISPRVSTVGGLILGHLGRAPIVGDAVQIGNLRLEVTEVEGSRVTSAIVSGIEEAGSEAP